MIDKNSPIPLYYQIENYIRTLIEKENLKPNEAIPTEKELTEQFRVSRVTIQQAIRNLINDGLLVRKRGKGTFVVEQKIEKGPSVYSFTEEMKRRNMQPGTKFIHMKEIIPSEILANRLEIATEQKVFQIYRLRLADDMPMALETAYIPTFCVPTLNEQDLKQNGSLYEILNLNGIEITDVERSIEISATTSEQAKWLKVPQNTPVLLVNGRTFTKDEKVIEYVNSIYRGDRYKFTFKSNASNSHP
jgi:GntR family transcriptional regulator